MVRGWCEVIGYNDEGVPFCCHNRRYMTQKYLSPRQLCGGCEFEISDFFHGTNGTEFFGWYCVFRSPGQAVK